MKVAVTGHRPNKLWGYEYSHPKYVALGWALRNTLISLQADHIISGMALGVDTIFALVGLKLKSNAMPNLTIECAIPCTNHSSKWLKTSVDLYDSIIKRSDLITYVTQEPYTMSCMQRRNEYMVDNCDVLIAVWDGTPGGTANCVKYAIEKGIQIQYINPSKI